MVACNIKNAASAPDNLEGSMIFRQMTTKVYGENVEGTVGSVLTLRLRALTNDHIFARI